MWSLDQSNLWVCQSLLPAAQNYRRRLTFRRHFEFLLAFDGTTRVVAETCSVLPIELYWDSIAIESVESVSLSITFACRVKLPPLSHTLPSFWIFTCIRPDHLHSCWNLQCTLNWLVLGQRCHWVNRIGEFVNQFCPRQNLWPASHILRSFWIFTRIRWDHPCCR